MTDIEFAKAIDICEKLDFFGGCRAGRELWFGKPVDVQDRDIQNFAEDVAFLKDFINRQKSEIERLNHIRAELSREIDRLKKAYSIYEETTGLKQVRYDAIKKLAEKFKERCGKESDCAIIWAKVTIDNLVKEMTEGQL